MDTVFNFGAKDHFQWPHLKLIYARHSKYDEDWHSTLHVHPYAELFYVTGGKGVMKVEDKIVPLQQDDLVIVGSNIRHTEDRRDESPFEYFVLGIEGLSLHKNRLPSIDALDSETNAPEELSDFLDTYTFLQNYADSRDTVYEILKQIIREMTEKASYFEPYANTLLRLLMLNILRLSDSQVVLESDVHSNKQLQYVKDFLDIHYSRDLRLDELANISYLNKYYLVHEFKRNYALTPIDYLLHKRIDVAKELLRTTDYTMEEIASIVGFNSQSYFNQVFKKKTHQTPTKYKRENKK